MRTTIKATVINRNEVFKRSWGSINSYVGACLALKQSEASELLNDDFLTKHPSAQITFLSGWPKMESKIKFPAEQMCVQNKETLDVLESLGTYVDNQEPDAVSLSAFFFPGR